MNMNPNSSEANRALTAKELFSVTGYKNAKKQHEFLSNNGIFSLLNEATNTIFTNWHHINNPFTIIQNDDDDCDSGPNWGPLDG